MESDVSDRVSMRRIADDPAARIVIEGNRLLLSFWHGSHLVEKEQRRILGIPSCT